MRYSIAAICLLLCLNTALAANACGLGVKLLVASALSPDQAVAEAAIGKLRAGGPETLASLFELRDELAASKEAADVAELKRLDTVIDRVGGQRYCTASRLFWHTDLAAAQAAAKESGKPILSLRMMGNLTDEFSCANSRFFRTSLYANREISDYLRSNFILHWKSVRPVPKVTIDFGDGRKLERTLTGNSIHYILAADGQPIDALPGLYGPAAFLERLRDTVAVSQAYTQAEPGKRPELLVRFHTQRLRAIGRAWQADLTKLGVSATSAPIESNGNEARLAEMKAAQQVGQQQAAPQAEAKPAPFPKAAVAAVIAEGKGRVEIPLIRVIASFGALEMTSDDGLWEKIAALHEPQAKLDEASIRLIRSENPTAAQAGRLAITKRLLEDPILKLVASFQASIALDTVRNEYVLHRKLHQWFVDGVADSNVEKLNEKVYAELFLTPSADPWIGLAPPDAYTALENGGVVRPGGK